MRSAEPAALRPGPAPRGGSTLSAVLRCARWALAVTALLAPCVAGAADPGRGAVPRTIVVRGHVRSPDGHPLAGARVTARGTANVNAVSDLNGRYTLPVPLGLPAAVRRLPYHLEVRAESGGRRLPLAGGGASLVIDASWRPENGRVRVESNLEAAATAIATALEVDQVTVAWVDADFGVGAEAPAKDFVRDAILPRDPAATSAGPMPPPAPGPRASLQRGPGAGDGAASRSLKPVPRNSVPAVKAPDPVPAPGDSTDLAVARPDPARRAAATPRRERRARPGASDSSRLVVTTGTVPAPAPEGSPVRPVARGTRGDSAAARDSCRCSVRGTVEIRWDRPLEDDTPIRVTIDAPGAPPADLKLFMGAPREFRFGPLPCGEWKLTFEAGGKFHYTDERGDTTRVVRCAGATETRVVLVPARR